MSRWGWVLGAVLLVVVVAAALAGVWTWHIPALLVLVGGWFAAAVGVGRDADRLGLDGDRWTWNVVAFGWLGLGYWFVKRRRLSSEPKS